MMAWRSLSFLTAAFCAVVLCGDPSHAADETRLVVKSASGPHVFSVEVMRTRADLEKGLMFRRHLAPDAGMLFDFGEPQTVSMWMKNTYLPLDMLFIDKGGHVVSVARDAKPMSETIIPSGGAVTGVLEINAGASDRIGVKPGDEVQHPMFGP